MDFKIKAKTPAAMRHAIEDIPGDKSISHRAIILGSLSSNRVVFTNFLDALDCMHTSNIFQMMGVPIIHSLIDKTVMIDGVGIHGLQQPEDPLYVGNSGTGIRLITGVLSGQIFDSQIYGDESIQTRPMKRVIDPLTLMGAHIKGTLIEGKKDIYPPLTLSGNSGLNGISYTLPVASAQVKSAILFASLYSDTPTIVTEPKKCRDHTENMLKGFGADIQVAGKKIRCSGKNILRNPDTNTAIHIPSDISSAAFFIVLGCLVSSSQLTFTGIGLNSTRVALLHVLLEMGVTLKIQNQKGQDMEPYGDITVATSALHNIEVSEKFIPFLIDEIPILAIAAMFGKGTLKITKAEELRTKESDRISAIVDMVRNMGGTIQEFPDGFELTGPSEFKEFKVNSKKDHRIAMSAIIGAIASGKSAVVEDCECIDTSFPNFFDILRSLNIDFELE